MNSTPSTFRLPRLFRRQPPRPGNSERTLAAAIRCRRQSLAGLADVELTEQAAALKQSVAEGRQVLDREVMVPTFALVLEAARRVLDVELYDVQLMAGLALAGGSIAEMQTGEGKTFAALLPANLHALPGGGVHVMTVNAYLAQRDYEMLTPVYRLLGQSVGLIKADMDSDSKRAAYACDVTYGPGYEFGFDYLRDQLARIAMGRPRLGERFRDRLHGRTAAQPQRMQRGHAVAVVNEADSVMIDEATTPLVLAGGNNQPAANAAVYRAALQAADQLQTDHDFVLDEVRATAQLTHQGLQHLSSAAPPQLRLDRPWPVYIEQALRAGKHFCRDTHYVVRDDQIHIVDQHTGRIFVDRSWCDGLHQAVQAKERVTITAETNSLARITRQRYFRLYQRICGMTGTARGSEPELRESYGLNVVIIPPHRPCRRQTPPPRVFADRQAKEDAIVETIAHVQATGRPVLVGTSSIETSQQLAARLDHLQISYQLLNGKQDAEEAEIVAEAGRPGAVTIATNMAGRGTDIRLGEGVAALGGLFVIATEPQDCRRVDRQLAGRAARQGDPGTCQLFAAADDPLFSQSAKRLGVRIKRRAADAGEVHEDLSGPIAAVQRQVERRQKLQRRQTRDHDDWLDKVLSELADDDANPGSARK